eukprot:CAMPEP_0183356030 /NCGR_PEP_ID=MMETSP0164_2-20130417/42794_1 /TAXON_ID=221442 /ORGANISM="Coccolithus pelagicus ssp braarudi, Strain PLY182g" /LENGTH=154 /DNA_ID=CAMNT_0025529313 /DNA_START=211 /DNA_END=676 /DNA_ORIENTATION=+
MPSNPPKCSARENGGSNLLYGPLLVPGSCGREARGLKVDARIDNTYSNSLAKVQSVEKRVGDTLANTSEVIPRCNDSKRALAIQPIAERPTDMQYRHLKVSNTFKGEDILLLRTANRAHEQLQQLSAVAGSTKQIDRRQRMPNPLRIEVVQHEE